MLPARTKVLARSESLWHVSPLRLAEASPVPENRLDRVRLAAAEFVRGTTLGWSRRDLAEWLVCHYAPCAAAPVFNERDHVHDEEITETRRALKAEMSESGVRTIDADDIERVVHESRTRVLRLLADLVVP